MNFRSKTINRKSTKIKKKEKRTEIINPFVYSWDLAWYHWAKMIILSFILAPLRFSAFLIFFTASYLLCFIATAGQNESERSKPMCGWRKNIVMPLFYIFARSVYFCASFQWIKVKGTRCSRIEAPILVLAPHSAFMDSLVVVFLGMSSVVGKTETANSIIGYFLKMTQPMLVMREDPNSRKKTVDQIINRAKSEEDWPQMLIFSEGTCTNRSCLINFKTGAFIPGCAIQPVVLRWQNRVDCVTWTWDGPGIWTLLWMMFTQFHSYLEIEFLPIYYPNSEEKKNPRLFANNVRGIMARSLNIQTTNHSYEDCRHMTLAKKNGLPFSEIIVEFTMLFKKIILPYPDAISMLDKFVKIASISEFPISVYDMCEKISFDSEDILFNKVFQFYDRDNRATINFRDLFVHMCLYTLPLQRKLAFKYILEAFNIDNVHDIPILGRILMDSFDLSAEFAENIVTLVEERALKNKNFTGILDTIMDELGEPFNMYENYQREYNKSIKQALLPCVSSSEEVRDHAEDHGKLD